MVAAPSATSKSKKKQPARAAKDIESDIETAEQNLRRLSEQLGQPHVTRNPLQLASLNDEYRQTETRLQKLYAEWEDTSA